MKLEDNAITVRINKSFQLNAMFPPQIKTVTFLKLNCMTQFFKFRQSREGKKKLTDDNDGDASL